MKKLLPTPGMKDPAPESLCNHCGKCCYKKIIVGRTVYITPFPCEYLDTQTNLCTIYERRHELNPECLSIETGMKHNAFPTDCPYVPVAAPKNYKPAREDYDWAAEWDEFDAIADDLDVEPHTRRVVHERGPLARPMHAEAFERIQAGQAAPVLADLVRAESLVARRP
jgi:Fe-S-cluster containining protein